MLYTENLLSKIYWTCKVSSSNILLHAKGISNNNMVVDICYRWWVSNIQLKRRIIYMLFIPCMHIIPITCFKLYRYTVFINFIVLYLSCICIICKYTSLNINSLCMEVKLFKFVLIRIYSYYRYKFVQIRTNSYIFILLMQIRTNSY